MGTLESGIVVLVGIIVLMGTFDRIDKSTGGNKCTHWCALLPMNIP